MPIRLFISSFFSHTATAKGPPGSPSLKDLQSVNLKDQAGKGTAFQYTYPKETDWLVIYISVIQPILLHSVHIYQPINHSQSNSLSPSLPPYFSLSPSLPPYFSLSPSRHSYFLFFCTTGGPSQVKLEYSRPSSLSKPIQLTPPLNTTGLTGIRIELTSPVIAKEVWLHLRRPTVTDMLSISNLLLLGSVYGSTAQLLRDEEREEKRVTATVNDNKDAPHLRYDSAYSLYIIRFR